MKKTPVLCNQGLSLAVLMSVLSVWAEPIPLDNSWKNDTVYQADRAIYDISRKDSVLVNDVRYHHTGFEKPLDTAFCLRGLKNVTLDFGGATVFLHGKLQPFLLDGCENVTIKNVKVRYDRCGYSQAQVVSVDEKTLTVRFDKEKFPYRVVDGALEFYAKDWVGQRLEKGPGFLQFFDGRTRQGKCLELVFLSPNPFVDPAFPFAAGAYKLVSEERGDLVVMRSKDRPIGFCGRVAPGDYVVVAHEPRDLSNCFMVECRDVTLENYRVINGTGMGIYPFHCHNVTLDRFKMCYDAESPSIVANGADGVHAVACSGKFVLKNCVIEGTIDDALNVHGNFFVLKSAKGNRIVADTGHSAVAPYSSSPIFRPHDRIRVCKGFSNETACEYTVVATEPIDQHTVALVVDRPTEALKPDSAIENLSAQCELVITGCRFGKSNTHLRFQTRGGVRVEDCETELPFLLTGDMSYWFESSPVEKMLVKNVRFATGRATFGLTPQYFPTEAAPYYHGELNLEDCTFDNPNIVNATGLRKLVVGGCRQKDGIPLHLRLVNCGEAVAPGCEIARETKTIDALNVN